MNFICELKRASALTVVTYGIIADFSTTEKGDLPTISSSSSKDFIYMHGVIFLSVTHRRIAAKSFDYRLFGNALAYLSFL